MCWPSDCVNYSENDISRLCIGEYEQVCPAALYENSSIDISGYLFTCKIFNVCKSYTVKRDLDSGRRCGSNAFCRSLVEDLLNEIISSFRS